MKERRNAKRLVAWLLTAAMLLTGLVTGNLGNQVYATTVPDGATVVLACSDYQNESGNDANATFCTTLFNTIKSSGYHSINGFLCAGDYDYDLTYTVANTQAGVTSLKNTVENIYGTSIDEVFVQGNHDSEIGTAGMSASGNNDPTSGKYGVFVINEDDYMWYGNDEARVKQTAANLKSYLDAKRNADFTAPIFVISHLPLHYSMRTYEDGDGRYANYLFDVMNEAGNAGLNIIYLYGHDHSNGWDDYLGGAAVYLAKGSSINIAQASQYSYKAETLAFTYMNAGYVGYYNVVNTGVDDTLTSTVFTITDDAVTVERYDTTGIHNLKSAGVANATHSEATKGGYSPDTTVVGSPQTITLSKDITPASSSGGDSETTTTERTYQRVTAVTDLQDGDQVLMIYEGTKFMLPSVITTKGTKTTYRTGFNLESTSLTMSDTITGDYSAKEWTFDTSDSGATWTLGATVDGAKKYTVLTSTTDYAITATLEDNGEVFTIGGAANAYTFTDQSNSYVLNYNESRELINGYDGNAATFYLYRMTSPGTTACTHTNTEIRNAVAATCTAAGYTGDTYCKDCGEKIATGETIAATGHSYDEGVVTTAATCTTAGVMTYTCSACGDTYTEAIPAGGAHSYGEGVVTKAATCMKAGVKTYTCSVCGNTYTETVRATGHSYDGGVITTEAACTTAGIKTYTCGVCDYSYTTTIDALGHNYVDGKCTRCGEADPTAQTSVKVPFCTVNAVQGNASRKIKIIGKLTDYEHLADYNITGHGILYITASRLGSKELTVDTSGRTKVTFGAYNDDGSFTYTFRAASNTTKYVVRTWISCTDSDGNTVYVYSAPMTVSYNTVS